jgi:hypothetical protein
MGSIDRDGASSDYEILFKNYKYKAGMQRHQCNFFIDSQDTVLLASVLTISVV